MKIIDYFEREDREALAEQIGRGDWSAAKYLEKMLRQGRFQQEMGRGTVLLMLDGERIVSFLTLSQRDCIADDSLYPWVGFFYTFPQYRGRRHGGALLDHAAEEARKQGHKNLWLATEEVGLYEKYGFSYVENRRDIWGKDTPRR